MSDTLKNNGGFILFSGEDFYACGGWIDYIGRFDNVASAVEWYVNKLKSNSNYQWYHVVDLETNKIVALRSGTFCGDVQLEQCAEGVIVNEG